MANPATGPCAVDARTEVGEMASVYKRGNTWWVRFQWRGQEVRRSARTAVKSQAREYLADLQAQYRQLDIGGRPRVTFDQAAVAFFEEEAPHKKPSTIRYYQDCTKVLREEFGGKYLDEINRVAIASFEAKQSKKKSLARVRHYRVTLSGIFKVAIRHDWAERNPCRDLKPIKLNNARHRYLTAKEWADLKDALKDPVRGIAEMSVLRGMRLGEIVNLKWRDVSLRADTITLHDTKGNRPRVIPLEGARAVVERQPRVSEYIFPNSAGNLYQKSDVSNLVKKAARLKEIEDFTFHDLRHTYASWYVQRGGDLYRLQQILGHKGPAMTQRYAHLRVDDLREDAQMSAHDTTGFLN